MPRIKLCKEKECHNSQTTGGYCRLHYLRYWKKIKTDKQKKAAVHLNKYIEGIMRRHPDRFVEEIKKDIRSDDFDERIVTQFGPLDESDNLFDLPSSSDEELNEMIERIKVETDF
ncbi:MAG: hypothetical protein Q7S68_03825 [Deltaproteobacteria bacterium]|nr:hypothetical protein [Deltaproteobacteria bacterium]